MKRRDMKKEIKWVSGNMNWNRSFRNKDEERFYLFICPAIWGCCPLDIDWAVGTNIYNFAKSELEYLCKGKDMDDIEMVELIYLVRKI